MLGNDLGLWYVLSSYELKVLAAPSVMSFFNGQTLTINAFCNQF